MDKSHIARERWREIEMGRERERDRVSERERKNNLCFKDLVFSSFVSEGNTTCRLIASSRSTGLWPRGQSRLPGKGCYRLQGMNACMKGCEALIVKPFERPHVKRVLYDTAMVLFCWCVDVFGRGTVKLRCC